MADKTPIATPDIPREAAITDFLGNVLKDTGILDTAPVSFANVSAQLAASGPLADALAQLSVGDAVAPSASLPELVAKPTAGLIVGKSTARVVDGPDAGIYAWEGEPPAWVKKGPLPEADVTALDGRVGNVEGQAEDLETRASATEAALAALGAVSPRTIGGPLKRGIKTAIVTPSYRVCERVNHDGTAYYADDLVTKSGPLKRGFKTIFADRRGRVITGTKIDGTEAGFGAGGGGSGDSAILLAPWVWVKPAAGVMRIPGAGIDYGIGSYGQSYNIFTNSVSNIPYRSTAIRPGKLVMPSVGMIPAGAPFSTYTDLVEGGTRTRRGLSGIVSSSS